MFLLSFLLPFFNFIVLVSFSRFIGRVGAIFITFINLLLTFILSCYVLFTLVTTQTSFYICFGTWLQAFFVVRWEIFFDPLAGIMLWMVSLISLLVHVYSFSYMQGDPHINRFLSYLSLFTFFMFVLVTAPNFFVLFLGWEGVGLCSYLLINFWTTRLQASKAAIKAVLINRIGDLSVIFAIAWIINLLNTVDFSVIFVCAPLLNDVTDLVLVDFFFGPVYKFYPTDVICFFLFVGIMSKSAQIGLHTWLPAAMEGPTPVSALIHAATMVTAGVFLLIRCSFLFELSWFVNFLAVTCGVLTAVLSAATACFLFDIKRIIAYSTCSQLGYMVLAAGICQYNASLFHLVNHAFFKALLFLTAGAIIHTFSGEQDIRRLSGLYIKSPFLFVSIFVGNIAIMGLPFLSGFFSKDLIVELFVVNAHTNMDFSTILLFGVLLPTFLTAVYSLRLVYYLFFKIGNSYFYQVRLPFHTQPNLVSVVLVILMFFSIFSGFLLTEIFSTTNSFWITGVTDSWSLSLGLSYEYVSFVKKLLAFICNFFVVLGFCFFVLFQKIHLGVSFRRRQKVKNGFLKVFISTKSQDFLYFDTVFLDAVFLREISTLFYFNFYFNEFYNFFVMHQFFNFYGYVFTNFDKGCLEYFGPFNFASLYEKVCEFSSKFYYQPFGRQLFAVYNVIFLLFFSLDFII